MGAVLKGPAAALVTRPLATKASPILEIVLAEPEPSADALELEELRIEHARLRAALSAADEHREAKVAEASRDGKAQGRAEAVADEAAKFALIDDALIKALSAWDARLSGLDGLAAQLTRASVKKVFGSWDDGSELVIRAARTRLDLLSREAIITLHLSKADFPDEQALAAAAEQLRRSRSELAIDPDLGAGDCRIGLKLGAIDIGPNGQVAALAALLDQLDEAKSA